MGIKTKLEFCDSTINPIMGCGGCELYHPNPARNHCYAAALCNRYGGLKGWPDAFDCPRHFPGRLEKAIKWKDLTGTDRPDKPWLNGYPRIIFVNDLSDGFCDDVDPSEWLGPCLHKMSQSPHIWLLLTKWPRAMGHFFPDGAPENFWLGTSVLRQKDEWRIQELLQIKASVHWLSLEPLLSLVDLSEYLPLISWTIIGGESGPGARPMYPQWARDVRDQCQEAGTPYFFKQQGEWIHKSQQKKQAWPDGARQSHLWWSKDKSFSYRVGKKAAGRLLDGREWNEMPEKP